MKDILYGSVTTSKKYKLCIECKMPIHKYAKSDLCYWCKRRFIMSLSNCLSLSNRIKVRLIN